MSTVQRPPTPEDATSWLYDFASFYWTTSDQSSRDVLLEMRNNPEYTAFAEQARGFLGYLIRHPENVSALSLFEASEGNAAADLTTAEIKAELLDIWKICFGVNGPELVVVH